MKTESTAMYLDVQVCLPKDFCCLCEEEYTRYSKEKHHQHICQPCVKLVKGE